MTVPPPVGPSSASSFWRRNGAAIAALVVIAGGLLAAKYGGLVNAGELGAQLEQTMRAFADGPFGLPVLILVFCGGAFIAMPQFLLIGISVVAFGPAWGALWAWIANLTSGTLTYYIGALSARSVLRRLSGPRTLKFTQFIARNAFVASAIVRNAPAGPFLFVNMAFGAMRANFLHYIAGMAVGIVPKITLIAFGMKAVEAALRGNILLAAGAGLVALAVFAGGFLYVRRKRQRGEIIALGEPPAVDSAAGTQHE